MQSDRIERGAEAMAERMLRYDQSVHGAGPKKGPDVEAPYTNNAGEPSYYGKGTLPVVSTASGHRYTKGEWSWTLKTVSIHDLADYGLDFPVPEHAQCGHKAMIVQRGDWDHWEFNMGQHRRFQNFAPSVNVQVHHSNPVVLTHLEGRDIICESYAQAEAECARVGKQIAR